MQTDDDDLRRSRLLEVVREVVARLELIDDLHDAGRHGVRVQQLLERALHRYRYLHPDSPARVQDVPFIQDALREHAVKRGAVYAPGGTEILKEGDPTAPKCVFECALPRRFLYDESLLGVRWVRACGTAVTTRVYLTCTRDGACQFAGHGEDLYAWDEWDTWNARDDWTAADYEQDAVDAWGG